MSNLISVATWNIAGGFLFNNEIQDGFSYDEENLLYFIEQLKLHSPDIIGLQEVHLPLEKNSTSQLKLIAEELEYYSSNSYAYGTSHIKSGNSLCLGNVSRFPIIETKFYMLPNPNLVVSRPNGDVWKSFDVGFIISKIDFNGVLINFINGHMVPFHYFNRDFKDPDFQNIRNKIEELFLDLLVIPTIVSADFNYSNLGKLLPNMFKGNNYQMSFKNEITAPGKDQQDHILFSKHWSLNDYSIHKGRADHYLCISELKLQI